MMTMMSLPEPQQLSNDWPNAVGDDVAIVHTSCDLVETIVRSAMRELKKVFETQNRDKSMRNWLLKDWSQH